MMSMAIYYMFWTENTPRSWASITATISQSMRLLLQGPTLVLRDVTPEWDLAFRMIETFNRLNLSPIHLKDAVLDMLE